MKTLVLILAVLCSSFAGAQIQKDKIAHMSASAVIHSGTYIVVETLQDGRGKYWKPFVVVNIVGGAKEIYDSQQPHNRFSTGDMLYNNIGAILSLGLIELQRAIGIRDNISVGVVMGAGLIGLGIVTVNF